MAANYTLTGNFQQLTGVADATGQLVITLANYGNVQPRVSGTGIITTAPVVVTCVAGAFTQLLWGNDQILPTGTYYTVTFKTSSGAVCSSVAYQFNGGGSNDLSTLSPLAATPPQPITLYAPLASPGLSGVPTAPTATIGTNTTQLATTAFVLANGTGAPLNSPAFTGIPTAPTPAPGTNTTQLATAAFVLANGGSTLYQTGLLARYNMTDGAGSTLTDSSGNANHGTLAAAGAAPTWIAITGGLTFAAPSTQYVTLPAALNVAKTIMLVTYLDPTDVNNNQYGSPLSPDTVGGGSNVGPNLMFSYAASVPSLAGSVQNYNALTRDGGIETTSLGFVHGYCIVTLTESVGGDTLYLGNKVHGTGSTIGQLASGNYQLGGGHGAGASTWYNGQILFAAFWSGTLTAAQVAQNVQAVQQLLAARGLVLNGIPGAGTWQTPNSSTDTFVVDGDSLTTQIGSLPTITGSPLVLDSGKSGTTAEQIAANAPSRVDVNLPNLGTTVNGGTEGTGANRAGVIAFMGTNDSALAPSIPLGTLAKYVRDRKKAGWSKVFVTTKLSQTVTDVIFKRPFNGGIRQYWSGWPADGLLDLGAIYPLGSDLANNNTVYFSSNLHWNTAISQQMSGWAYSYAIRRMYGNTISGTPNIAVATPYLCVPEDIFWIANLGSAIDAYLIPAQFFTGQTVMVRNQGAGALTLRPKPIVSSTISATSLTSTTLTVTVANNFLPGDVIVFSSLNTNTTKNGFSGTILAATATQFTMTVVAASWSGSDSAGTATLANMCELAAITNLSLTTNVASITAPNNYKAGDTVLLTGLTTTPGLNGTSAAVSATGLSISGFQLPITRANIGAGAEAGFGIKTFPAETINGASSLVVASGATCVLLSRLISDTTAGANWIALQNS